jgi:hypothetical protein
MRTRMVEERIGEDMGPIDWSHPMAAGLNSDLAATLREAELNPMEFRARVAHSDFMRDVWSVCMYDGWPYWRPTPFILVSGTLGAEWHSFDMVRKVERSNCVKRNSHE